MFLTLLLAAAFLLAGCQDGPLEPIVVDANAVTAEVNYSDLAAVLTDVVDKNGLIDPDLLEKRAGKLDAQLGLLAVTGPKTTPALFPTDGDKLAYWYNARAAWSLKLLLAAKCPRQLARRELQDRRFLLDGRRMTLAEIDAILGADADWRTVVSAPGVCLDRARLPTAPFEAQGVRARIAERFSEFLDDPKRFVIDVENRQVLVPPVLWQFRGRLIRDYETTYGAVGATLTTALLPHLSGSPLRRLQDAVGYPVVEAPSTGATAVKE